MLIEEVKGIITVAEWFEWLLSFSVLLLLLSFTIYYYLYVTICYYLLKPL